MDNKQQATPTGKIHALEDCGNGTYKIHTYIHQRDNLYTTIAATISRARFYELVRDMSFAFEAHFFGTQFYSLEKQMEFESEYLQWCEQHGKAVPV